MKIGKIAFLAGLVIAILGAFIDVGWFPWVLAVLGLIVGFLNVSDGESRGFLVAAIAFMLSAQALSGLPLVGDTITSIMNNIGYFVGAATLLVAIKALFELSKD